MEYELTWVTPQLAAGYAPMSYEELDSIRDQGIDAIVNLCGEFTDLHEIEEKAGFEVYYLPTPDEHAPEMAAMERALEWLDEAIYLGKKVLVHCRHGHGRTGTFVSAYLVRRGLGLKKAEKLLKNTRANPTNYAQWKLLRKFNKKEKALTAGQARADSKAAVASPLDPFLQEYEAILSELELELAELEEVSTCGGESAECCKEYFELELAESFWIHTRFNRRLSSDDRQEAIDRALESASMIRTIRRLHERHPALKNEDFGRTYRYAGVVCPLFSGGRCILHSGRPFRCRWHGSSFEQEFMNEYTDMLVNLSHNMYLALTGAFSPEGSFRFTMADTVSGRFVQTCFDIMLQNRQEK